MSCRTQCSESTHWRLAAGNWQLLLQWRAFGAGGTIILHPYHSILRAEKMLHAGAIGLGRISVNGECIYLPVMLRVNAGISKYVSRFDAAGQRGVNESGMVLIRRSIARRLGKLLQRLRIMPILGLILDCRCGNGAHTGGRGRF